MLCVQHSKQENPNWRCRNLKNHRIKKKEESYTSCCQGFSFWFCGFCFPVLSFFEFKLWFKMLNKGSKQKKWLRLERTKKKKKLKIKQKFKSISMTLDGVLPIEIKIIEKIKIFKTKKWNKSKTKKKKFSSQFQPRKKN